MRLRGVGGASSRPSWLWSPPSPSRCDCTLSCVLRLPLPYSHHTTNTPPSCGVCRVSFSFLSCMGGMSRLRSMYVRDGDHSAGLFRSIWHWLFRNRATGDPKLEIVVGITNSSYCAGRDSDPETFGAMFGQERAKTRRRADRGRVICHGGVESPCYLVYPNGFC